MKEVYIFDADESRTLAVFLREHMDGDDFALELCFEKRRDGRSAVEVRCTGCGRVAQLGKD